MLGSSETPEQKEAKVRQVEEEIIVAEEAVDACNRSIRYENLIFLYPACIDVYLLEYI